MSELADESGVTARTIRYYIAQGLLQPAYGRGPTAVYDGDHLLRLQYIQKLKDDRLPLLEIRERLNRLTSEDLALAMQSETQPMMEMWRRYRLHPDFEVVIRDRSAGEAPATQLRAFELIVEYARTVLGDLDRRPDDEY